MNSLTKSPKPILAPDDQSVSFAELFFDLVFVFSVTQVVHLLHGAFDWIHVGRAILVFWLVWWAWTQFTWALNAANTEHHLVQFATIIATVLAFFIAVSVPQTFTDFSWWFAVSYVAVRTIGLLIYLWVSWGNVKMRSAVTTFSTISISGLVAVIVGGIMGGDAQYWFWGLAILLDVVAATIGANNSGWGLFPKHFAERHGLFVIIVLGETLIVAASAVAEESWNSHLLIISMLAVGITACLWWLYFVRIKGCLEHAMHQREGSAQSSMGRDVFSLWHFPMLCGLIIYAYAIEEAMVHPDDVMTIQARLALSTGIMLYSTSIVISFWRATGKILFLRVGFTLAIAGICFAYSGIPVMGTLGIAFLGLLLLCVFEEKTDTEIEME
jgi:low temperature requirement protein LtrA